MFRNTYTPTTGAKTRLSVYFLLIFTVFLFYSCDNVPTDSFVVDEPDQNEDITNPVTDSTDTSEDPPDDNDGDEGSDDEPDTPPATEQGFVIFDGMSSRQKPEADIAAAGLKPVDVIYSTRMFDGRNAGDLKREGSTELPDKQVVNQLAHNAAQINDEFGVIDIEHWMLNPEKGYSAAEIQANLERHLTVLEWYQEAEPDMKWGYYGEVPIRNYWAANKPGSERYKNWQDANSAIKPLAQKADVLMPSLYTFYEDREGWVRYAEEHIAEARRLNPDVPVYVYLWPEYHMSGVGLKPIEPEFWRLQLDTALEHADGIVIYTRGSYSFTSSTPWWKVTKEFMKELEQGN